MAFFGIRQGSSKTPRKHFYKKSMSKTFFETIDQKNDIFSLDFFLFYRVPGASQRWEFKNTTKRNLQKVHVEKNYKKNITKKSTKKSKTVFSRFFLITAFSGVSRCGDFKITTNKTREVFRSR
jgi:hypothetical protein